MLMQQGFFLGWLLGSTMSPGSSPPPDYRMHSVQLIGSPEFKQSWVIDWDKTRIVKGACISSKSDLSEIVQAGFENKKLIAEKLPTNDIIVRAALIESPCWHLVARVTEGSNTR